jgi:predicted  nucleic acid-binding Zn-ribbon protein
VSGGQLVDGTPYFGQLGQLARDPAEDRVQCHLCGRWFRAVGGAHLRLAHGWTLAEYRIAFQLATSTPTVARQLSAEQRARLIARLAAGELPDPPRPRPSHERTWVAPGRSLGALHPVVARELHPAKNGDIDPLRVGSFSLRRLWWRCTTCGHEWQTTPQNRVGNQRGCPACAIARRGPRGPVAPQRSLAQLRPDLAREALDVDPSQLGTGSRTRVRWRCSTCGHEWVATVKKRANEGSGCPRCVNRRLGERRRIVPYERSISGFVPRPRSRPASDPQPAKPQRSRNDWAPHPTRALVAMPTMRPRVATNSSKRAAQTRLPVLLTESDERLRPVGMATGRHAPSPAERDQQSLADVGARNDAIRI